MSHDVDGDEMEDGGVGVGRPLARGHWLLGSILVVLAVAVCLVISMVWRKDASDPAAARISGAPATNGETVAAAAPEGRRIGAWTAQCAGEAADCSLHQTQAGIGDAGLTSSWRIESDAGALIGVWTVPTGILVRSGMLLGFDEHDPVNVPFDSCEREGCEVRAKLTPGFVETMRTARAGIVTVNLKGARAQAFRFDLDGLAEGLVLLPPQEAAAPQD
jgi:invasion protein IalB